MICRWDLRWDGLGTSPLPAWPDVSTCPSCGRQQLVPCIDQTKQHQHQHGWMHLGINSLILSEYILWTSLPCLSFASFAEVFLFHKEKREYYCLGFWIRPGLYVCLHMLITLLCLSVSSMQVGILHHDFKFVTCYLCSSTNRVTLVFVVWLELLLLFGAGMLLKKHDSWSANIV